VSIPQFHRFESQNECDFFGQTNVIGYWQVHPGSFGKTFHDNCDASGKSGAQSTDLGDSS